MNISKIIKAKPAWVSRQISDLEAVHISQELKSIGAVRALEIGCASGFSSAVIYGQLEENDPKNCEMQCFDLSEACYYNADYKTGDALWQIHGEEANVTYTTGVTSADIRNVSSKNGELFDFLFIDANHRNPWAALDLLSLARFVKPEGLIGLDDITMMYNPKFRDCNGGRDLYRTWKGMKWRYKDVPNIGFVKRGSNRTVAHSVLSCLEVDWDQYPEVAQIHDFSEIAEFYGDPYASRIIGALNEKTGSKRRLIKKDTFGLSADIKDQKTSPRLAKPSVAKPSVAKTLLAKLNLTVSENTGQPTIKTPSKSSHKPRAVSPFPVEFTDIERKIFNYIFESGLTMVSGERLYATILACKYALENKIEGDFVECGVWRGGVALAVKMMFEAYDSKKNVYLFDTFAGMTAPTEFDFSAREEITASARFKKQQKGDHNSWCYASLEDVINNFKQAGVDMSGVHLVKGDVLKTLAVASNLPKKISILRLDTDWYESTKFELEVLYPKLQNRGSLLIDDYGYWEGARKAVEEYFKTSEFARPYLQYTDNTGRAGIKI